MPTVVLALEETIGRKPQQAPATRVSNYFGSRIFNRKAMREYMTSEAYKAVVDAMDNGTKINRNIADQVAAGMKAWALNLAQRITHWFNHSRVQQLKNMILSLSLREMERLLKNSLAACWCNKT